MPNISPSIFPARMFFDIDEIADTKSSLPHMLPPPEKFSSRMRSMGIGDGSRIVIYDSRGLFSAARVWWTFRVMGVDDVSVLEWRFAEMEGGGPADRKRPAGRPHHAPLHRAAQPRSGARRVRHQGAAQRQVGRDRRCAGAGAVRRQGAGAAAGFALGAYSRRRTICPTAKLLNQDGTLKSAPRARAAVRRSRRRSLEAGGDELRLGHHRERAGAWRLPRSVIAGPRSMTGRGRNGAPIKAFPSRPARLRGDPLAGRPR